MHTFLRKLFDIVSAECDFGSWLPFFCEIHAKHRLDDITVWYLGEDAFERFSSTLKWTQSNYTAESISFKVFSLIYTQKAHAILAQFLAVWRAEAYFVHADSPRYKTFAILKLRPLASILVRHLKVATWFGLIFFQTWIVTRCWLTVVSHKVHARTSCIELYTHWLKWLAHPYLTDILKTIDVLKVNLAHWLIFRRCNLRRLGDRLFKRLYGCRSFDSLGFRRWCCWLFWIDFF